MKMIRQLFAFLTLTLHTILGFSQGSQNQWAFSLAGNTSADVAYDVEVDSLGNTYVGGNFQGTIDFDPNAGIANVTATGGGWDIFLAKYDVNGNYVWAFKIPGVGGNDMITHIAIDSQGDCYVTGWFAGNNVDFDPGAGVANVNSFGGNDIFVAKYNTNGIYQWAFAVGSNSMDAGNGIAVDRSGNCYVTGNFSGTNVDFNPSTFSTAFLSSVAGSNDLFLAKYNSNGIYQWAFNIGSAGIDMGWSVATDMSSNVYLTGQFSGSNVNFNPSGSALLNSIGSSDICVAKYNSAGNYMWAINAGGTSSDIGFAIAVDGSGNAYVSGTFQGTSNFNSSGAANLTSTGGDDIFVSKYSSGGAYVWAFKIGGAGTDNSYYKSTDIALDCADNVYIAGGFASSNVDFDPGSGNVLLSSSGSKDIFVAQYNTNGNYSCAFKVGQSSEDDAYGIAVSQNGCHVVGRFQGSNMNFNPSGTTAKNLSSSVWSDVFVGKYSMCQPPVLNFANINGQQNICTGTNLTLTASGGGTYLWNNSSTSAIINISPASPTTYSVVVTTGKFCRDTAYAFVDVFANPVLTVSPNTSICSGQSASLTVSGATNYVWSPNAGINSTTGNNITASPTTNTTYSVVGTDANGCSSSTITAVTVNAVPSLSITGNSSMCEGFSMVLSVFGGSNYLWTPSTGLNNNTGAIVTASPTSSTTYSVIATDNNGCTNAISTVLTISPNPIVTANVPSTICVGQSTNISAAGASIYNWAPIGVAGNALSVSPSNTTIYTVTGIDVNGCSSSATTTVVVNPLPVINTTQNISICIGASASLSANGAINYTWQPININSASVIISPTITSTYSVTGTDNNGCSTTATTTVTVNSLPIVVITPSTTICTGSNIVLSASGATNYLWSPSSSLSSNIGSSVIASPTTATTYSVIATDNNGCTNTSTTTITLNTPLSGLVSPDTAICIGNTAGLNATGSGGGSGYFYNWQPGNIFSQAILVSPTTTTTYSVTITDNCSSTPYTKEVTVSVNSLPAVSFSSDKISGCGPLCVVFTNTTPATHAAIWNFGDGNNSDGDITDNCYTNAGSYNVSLTVTDTNGCSNSLMLANYITVHPNPVAGFSYSPNEISIINAQVNFSDQSTGAQNWVWWFGDTQDNASSQQHPSFTYPDTGSYVVKQIVINEFGCVDTTEQKLRIKPDYVLYIPNTFTPNGDLQNEIFIPSGIGIDTQKFDFYIFDRWGDLIFHSEDINQGWDGKANKGAAVAQQDTYVWKLELKDVLGYVHRYVGHVNLVR